MNHKTFRNAVKLTTMANKPMKAADWLKQNSKIDTAENNLPSKVDALMTEFQQYAEYYHAEMSKETIDTNGITSELLPTYTCRCGGCNELFKLDEEGSGQWLEKQSLLEWLDHDEYWEFHKYRWYCSDCVTHDDEGNEIYKTYEELKHIQ